MSINSSRPVLSEEKRARLQALLAQEGLGKQTSGVTSGSREQLLPLTSGQERLWFLDQLHPGIVAYNIPAAAWINGALDVDQVRAAFEGVVRRHEVLRTTFASDGGRPRQVIREDANLPFECVDLVVENSEQQVADARALELANVEARRAFDLEAGPLVRLSLWRTGPKRHLLLLMTHHIISEGPTISWIFEEAQELYAAALEERPAQLTERPLEYVDFALWQRDWIAGGGPEKDLTYWRKKLAGELPLLQLPTDHPRQHEVTYAGAWFTRTLPMELVHAVQALAKGERASLFMVCHAALDILLKRYTQQEDILMGGTVGLRPRKETEGMLGFFVNTVVYRIDLSGEPSFRELLKRVRNEALDVLSHHDVPFERVAEAAQADQPDRDPNSSPLLQVIYDHESVESIGGLHLKGTQPAEILRPEYVHNGCTKADLMFFTEESAGGLITAVEYNTDLFDESTAARLIDHFEVLLRSAVANPDQSIGELSMLRDAERAVVLSEFNSEDAEFPVYCIHHELARLAAEKPEAPALRCDGVTYTRADLDARSNRIAQALIQRGVGPDVLVGICTDRGFDMVAATLGILKAGGAYLPIDPKSPATRTAFILGDSNSPVLLTQAKLRDVLPVELTQAGSATEVIVLDDPDSGLDGLPNVDPAVDVSPSNLAYAIFTSGSTGQPKGVPIPHSNFARLITGTDAWYGFGEDDIWITLHSFGFDVSVWEVWGALVTGGTLVLASFEVAQSPGLRYQLCADEGVTILNQTPSAFVQLIEAEGALAAAHQRGGPALPELALRLVVFAGEALEFQSLRPWFERHGDTLPRLVNMYGITETTVHVTYRPVCMRDLDEGRGSVIGVPIPDLQVYILDEFKEPVPIGVTGELYVAGPGVAPGYLRRPELTAERFLENHLSGTPSATLYRSGDLGRWLPNGEIEYLGRIDNQVQLRGFRIELGEIDACLGEHPAVATAMTMAREDRAGDKRLATYIVCKEERSASVQELKAHVAERLPDYMVPSAVVFLEAFPLTINDKIDRRALPVPEITGEDLGVEFITPRSATEVTLAEHWAEVLGAERIGALDNFFELGGHSLLATVLLSRIRESFDADLPLRGIFESPTLEKLAASIDAICSSEQAPAASALPPIPTSDRREGPLSFDQESIWFFHKLEPTSPAYNVPVRMLLGGSFDGRHMGEAFLELVRRHEALRTRFVDRNGEPFQVIEERVPECEEFLQEVDLSHLPAAEAAAEVERLALEASGTLFDLEKAPLFRALVLRTSDEQATLVFIVHHLVVDGWSHGRLLDELIALFGALVDGRELPAPRSAARMVDYAAWQREVFPESETWAQELEWWTDTLAEAPTLIELPTDRPRPPQQKFDGNGERMLLPRSLSDGLRQLARREGATLFHVTLAAYQSLLHRLTHQDDLLVGAPIAKRTQTELEFAVGNVINTVALRSRVGDDPTLREMIAQARETMLAVDAHQDLPWEAIVQKLAPERNASTTPLVQVGFTLRDKGRVQSSGGVSFGIPTELFNGTTKSDLTVVVEEIDGDLQLLADYPTSLYDQETIRRFLGWYAQLLTAMVANPGTKVRRARYLPESEYAELVVGRNQTQLSYARDAAAHHLIEEQVQRMPSGVALIMGTETITYGELNAAANRWAHLLRARGVGVDDLVGLCAERSIDAVVGLLGILKAGAAYLPLDPEYPPGRIELMLTDAAPSIVLTQADLHDRLPLIDLSEDVTWAGEILDLDAPPRELQEQSIEDPEHLSDGGSLFNVLYTSGSTGKPKGVLGIHRSFVNRVDWQQRNLPWQPGEVASQKTT
ncbi:MAG: amino acid adenylation domain-containing protein, partial [Planctomycetota bacterium]